MSAELLQRLRTKLEFAERQRMLAVPVDLDDVKTFANLVSQRCNRGASRDRAAKNAREGVGDFHPAERALQDCERRLSQMRTERCNANCPILGGG